MRDKNLLDDYRQSRSNEAFARIVDRYLNVVFSTCLREVGDRQMAEDLTQAVFVVLARKASTLNPNVVLSGWLFNTCRLVTRNAMREERRRRDREKKAALMHPESDDSLWRSVDSSLNDALAALSTADRSVLLLRYFEDLSVAEVAVCLSISVDAAQMRILRALGRLRLVLAKEGIAVVSTAILGTLLAEGAVKAAPAVLSRGIVTGSTTLGSGTSIIVEAVLKQIWMAQLKVAAVVVGCAVLTVGAAVTATRHAGAVGAVTGGQPRLAGHVGPLVKDANTYHLTGTRMLAGKSVPWDIWGRKNPYFYYERSGSNITWDDGHSKVLVFGPSTYTGRTGTVAEVGAESDASRYRNGYNDVQPFNLNSESEWTLLTNSPSWRSGIANGKIKPSQTSGDVEEFDIDDTFYSSYTGGKVRRIFVVSTDGTLQNFTFEDQRSDGTDDIGKLTAEYGTAIPSFVLAPVDTSGMTVYNVADNGPSSLKSAKAAVRVAAVDANGNVILDAAMPSEPYLSSFIAVHNHLMAMCTGPGGNQITVPYVEVSTPKAPVGHYWLLVCPQDPLPAGYRPVVLNQGTDGYLSLSFSIPVDPPIDVIRAVHISANAAVTDGTSVDGPLDTTGAAASMDQFGLSSDMVARNVQQVRERYQASGH